jgi:uncharacterized protein (DUF2252 family)
MKDSLRVSCFFREAKRQAIFQCEFLTPNVWRQVACIGDGERTIYVGTQDKASRKSAPTPSSIS